MFPYQTPDDKLFKLLGSKKYDGYTSRLVARQLRHVADQIDANQIFNILSIHQDSCWIILPTQPSNGHLLEEWQEARSVIARFDNILHDLRKFGFSFITAIIAADSVIGQATGIGSLIVTPRVKVAIVLSTVVLVVSLYTLDRFSRAIQYGAELRALKIEKKLDMELTQKIKDLYEKEGAGNFVDVLYGGFILAAVVLGIALVWMDVFLIRFLLIVLAAAWSYDLLLHLWCLQKSGAWPVRDAINRAFRAFRRRKKRDAEFSEDPI
jgi:hypothetical protein